MPENCWVLTHPDGTRVDNGEYVEHHPTKAKAAQRVADDQVAGDLTPGYYVDATPRQLDQPCVHVVCACCEEVFDESGDGYIVHFDNAEDARLVTEAEWTEQGDGTFRCTACSPDGHCGDCLASRQEVSAL